MKPCACNGGQVFDRHVRAAVLYPHGYIGRIKICVNIGTETGMGNVKFRCDRVGKSENKTATTDETRIRMPSPDYNTGTDRVTVGRYQEAQFTGDPQSSLDVV